MTDMVVNGAERALLCETLQQLGQELDGGQLSKALDDFGFVDLLAALQRSVDAAKTARGESSGTDEDEKPAKKAAAKKSTTKTAAKKATTKKAAAKKTAKKAS